MLDVFSIVTVTKDIVECKKRLIERGDMYAKQSVVSRQKIAQSADEFIRDGVVMFP